jgi:multiple sugar transport system permease protein
MIDQHRKDRIFGIALMLPALFIVGIAIFIPVVQSVTMSFLDYRLSRNTDGHLWNSFANYQAMISSGDLQHAFAITFSFMILVVLLLFGIGMILALAFNTGKRNERLLRTLILLPWVTPTIISALLWSWIFQPQYGILNYLLTAVGAIGEPLNWLSSPTLALPSVAAAALWRQVPFMFLMLLAGLQGIPKEMYEAAWIDGTSAWQSFIHITLPFLRNVIRTTILISIITNFKQFPLFWTMTGGGPMDKTTTLAILSYKQAFVNLDFGRGAAVATVWMISLILISILYNRLFKTASY